MEKTMTNQARPALTAAPSAEIEIVTDELTEFFRPHYFPDEVLVELLAATRDRRVFLDELSAGAFRQFPTTEEFTDGQGV